MEPYEIVKMIMIIFAVIYFLFEILLNLNDIDNDSSNIILLEWSKDKFFFIPFALGAISGHLFLGTSNEALQMGSSMYPVIILFALVVISIVIGYKVRFKKTKLFLSLLLLVGLLYGHFFWSMNYSTLIQQ